MPSLRCPLACCNFGNLHQGLLPVDGTCNSFFSAVPRSNILFTSLVRALQVFGNTNGALNKMWNFISRGGFLVAGDVHGW